MHNTGIYIQCLVITYDRKESEKIIHIHIQIYIYTHTHKYKKKSYGQPRQHSKKQRHYFADKGPYSQSYGFSSSHVWM